MNPVFLDTSGLIALTDKDDYWHSRAVEARQRLYREQKDKDWGMTDCVSISLMTNCGVTDVFDLDHHFSQAGFHLLICE